jgi:hypothetical protein
MTDFSTLRLDRSRAHGTVHGVIQDGVHYHQDGLPFDAHGSLLIDRLTEEQLALATRKARRGKRAAPGDEAADPSKQAAERDADDAGVNLELWLRGEQKYLFDAVRTAVRARYSRDVASIGDAVEFLTLELHPPLVPAGEVTRRLAPK